MFLSNVTLWVPAAEFSYIRSHTGDRPTNFTIELSRGQRMVFSYVEDLRAQGLYVKHYR